MNNAYSDILNILKLARYFKIAKSVPRKVRQKGASLSVGHEKVYLMQNDANLSRSEIISTYVYKKGIGESNYSFGTAVGLMNTTINTCMIILVNWITDRLSDGENSLF